MVPVDFDGYVKKNIGSFYSIKETSFVLMVMNVNTLYLYFRQPSVVNFHNISLVSEI